MNRIPLLWFFLLALAGCSRPVAAPAANAGQPGALSGPVEVKTVKPERKTIRRTVEQPGHIEPFEQAPLHVKIPGFVRKVHVDIGDIVVGPRLDATGKEIKPGQLLAELAVPEMDEELKQKQAQVAIAKAVIEQSQAALVAAEANLRSAHAKVSEVQSGRARAVAESSRWQSQFSREQELVKRRVIEQQTLDETRFQVEVARTAADEVEAKVRSAQATEEESKAYRDKAAADVRVAQARAVMAEADQRRVEALLGYARITAPFDGIVTRRQVDTGHFLQPPAGARPEAVFTVARVDPIRVLVDVPEADAIFIKPDLEARVRVQGLRGQEFHGKVARSAWALDARTRTLRTEIDLPNPAGDLRPGMYAYATLTFEIADAFRVPTSAVLTQGEQTFCFLVEEGKVVRAPLRIGVREGQMVEVLKLQRKNTWVSLTGQESVIRESVPGLTEGQPVREK